MKNNDLEILFLEPVFKHTIWGGTRLKDEFGCNEEGNDIGEMWGISAHPCGDVTVKNGRYKGLHLSELWKKNRALFGDERGDVFPLLVKIIDARDDLSIQVHPDDRYAAEHENGTLGKTECWYVLDCPPEASLILGHSAGDKKELERLIDQGKWGKLIRRVPVKKGDFLQIDPGTVHALTKGCLILETQENSNITYRVYDYDRLQDGKKRELHLKQSKEVITTPARPIDECLVPACKRDREANNLHCIYGCEYYCIYEMWVDGQAQISGLSEFMLVSVVEGCGEADGYTLSRGDNFIIPVGYERVNFTGDMKIIASTPGRKEQGPI